MLIRRGKLCVTSNYSSENERREIPAAELQHPVRDKVCAI